MDTNTWILQDFLWVISVCVIKITQYKENICKTETMQKSHGDRQVDYACFSQHDSICGNLFARDISIVSMT